MFLFITTSGNFSPAHRAALDPGTAENGTEPQPGSPSPPRQGRNSCDPAALTTRCRCGRCVSVKDVENCRNCCRCVRPACMVEASAAMVTGLLGGLSTWLRPGAKWPPSQTLVAAASFAPPRTWPLGRLEVATRFPAAVSALSFRGTAEPPRGRAPIRAACCLAAAPRPAGYARLSVCEWACPPGSPADFTPQVFGPLSGAFDFAAAGFYPAGTQ